MDTAPLGTAKFIALIMASPMASKDLSLVCVKPFYSKQNFISRGECAQRVHCSCLQGNVTEASVSVSTGKSTYCRVSGVYRDK